MLLTVFRDLENLSAVIMIFIILDFLVSFNLNNKRIKMDDDKKNYLTVLKKFQSLIIENDRLKAENKKLKEQLSNFSVPDENKSGIIASTISAGIDIENDYKSTFKKNNSTSINNKSKPSEKIKLFMSLFKGREDVFAQRWQNKNGISGYSPVCANEWKPGICNKPRIKCFECPNKAFSTLNEKVIEEHLTGNTIVGIYPLLLGETCFFLAIDFDDESWEKDIGVLRNICSEFKIPFAVERSRSGKGAHFWFFFEDIIFASLARKFGTTLLTFAMEKNHEIKFKSYDRLFPNQDNMPKGGFGNLIALPLQMKARKKNNSVFIDENLIPYEDQWKFLSSLQKLSENQIEDFTSKFQTELKSDEFGILRKDEDEVNESKPWKKILRTELSRNDFPEKIILARANMLYILKKGISQKALNILKRLAAFKNPEFFKAQAMRLPTYNKPRIISCSDETDKYLCLPRGCEDDVINLLKRYDVDYDIEDKTNAGENINVEFNGVLKEVQMKAVSELLKYNYGVFAAPTGFGKTVIAAKLISEKKVNTLILVHRKQLQSQWTKKLSEFLIIREDKSRLSQKKSGSKRQYLIGLIGGGKEIITGIIDLAIMQSLYMDNEVKDFVSNYGMVIIDECHHIPAFSFEQILKSIHAKYVYGLTATPERLDGHHPIIFMQCGPIRYKVNTREYAEQSLFEHFVIPRFTGFRIPVDKGSANTFSDWKKISVQVLYSELVEDEMRNNLIVDDILKNFETGRNSLILTERTAHVDLLSKKLRERIPDVIALTGKTGAKETREILQRIAELPPEKQLTIVATGKYIGEGFDEPRLDTLFLAMPISWKGTLQQYIGRLNREYKDKKEVLVFDYVDVNVSMLERMYDKRLKGYAMLGYKVKAENLPAETANFIFNTKSFLPVYTNDIITAQHKILIVSPFISKRRIEQMQQYLSSAVDKNIHIKILTRPIESYNEGNKLNLFHTLESLKFLGINIEYKPNIHQKYAIIDERIIWYGSINLLSFGNAEESIMRIESSNIACELIRNLNE